MSELGYNAISPAPNAVWAPVAASAPQYNLVICFGPAVHCRDLGEAETLLADWAALV